MSEGDFTASTSTTAVDTIATPTIPDSDDTKSLPTWTNDDIIDISFTEEDMTFEDESHFEEEKKSPTKLIRPRERLPLKQEIIPRNKPLAPSESLNDLMQFSLDVNVPLGKSTHQMSEWEVYVRTCKFLEITPLTIYERQNTREELDLQFMGIGPKGALAVSRGLLLNDSIEYLNLADNDLNRESIYYIGLMLKENVRISKLDLSHNKIGAFGADALFDITENSNYCLKELKLAANEFHDSQATDIFEALNLNKSIEHVDLSCNKLGEMSGIAIRNYLVENTTMLSIDLNTNCLSGIGTQEIWKGLEENQTLLKIDLSWNGFGDEYPTAMAAMFARTKLEEINLSYNRIKNEGVKAIGKGLESNTTMKWLDISFNMFDSSVADLIMKAITKPESKMKYLNIKGIKAEQTFYDMVRKVSRTRNIEVVFLPDLRFERFIIRNCINRKETKCALLKIIKKYEEDNVDVKEYFQNQHIFFYEPREFANILMKLSKKIETYEAREVAKEEYIANNNESVCISHFLDQVRLFEGRYLN